MKKILYVALEFCGDLALLNVNDLNEQHKRGMRKKSQDIKLRIIDVRKNYLNVRRGKGKKTEKKF